MHDPYAMAYHGYGTGQEAPNIYGPRDKVYQAAHNMILAHACAYRSYKNMGFQGIFVFGSWFGHDSYLYNMFNVSLFTHRHVTTLSYRYMYSPTS